MSDIWSKVHALLVTGALSKGGTWGGPDCRAQLSMDIHLYESSFWVLMCIFTYFIFNINGTIKSLSKQIEVGLKASPMNSLSRTFEVIVGLLHFAMFAQLIYFKLSISSLTNMIQPCHVILLLEGIALLSTSSTGVYISIFILPALTGTLLAMLFPETTGLDQYLEMEAYWLQHYLIQAMPLYLLLRRNGLALQLCSYKTVRIGIWILYLLHFSVYEAVNLATNVNVEFMLCQTGAMEVIFANFPNWAMFPSYRTTLGWGVIVIGCTISYAYILTAKLIGAMIFDQKKLLKGKYD